MTKQESFELLSTIIASTPSGRERERRLREASEREGVSCDAIRARARRWASDNDLPYPQLRRRLNEGRSGVRVQRRQARAAWQAERLNAAIAALQAGASWNDVAKVLGIRSPEGAAQWVRRNAEKCAVEIGLSPTSRAG